MRFLYSNSLNDRAASRDHNRLGPAPLMAVFGGTAMSLLSLFSRFSRDVMTLTVFAVPVLVAIAPRTARADEPATATPPAAAAPAAAAAVVQLDADDHRATI